MERTPQTLADMLEERILPEQPLLNFCCDSKEEAVGLAAVLTQRGWKAESSQALTFSQETEPTEENTMRLVNVVTIDGRHEGASSDALDVPEHWAGEILAMRDVPGRGRCAVRRFIYTCGLLTRLELTDWTCEYDERYCYQSRSDALEALRTWDGRGDPPGPWIKEKTSERLGPGARAR
jgi:hypothetical protein